MIFCPHDRHSHATSVGYPGPRRTRGTRSPWRSLERPGAQPISAPDPRTRGADQSAPGTVQAPAPPQPGASASEGRQRRRGSTPAPHRSSRPRPVARSPRCTHRRAPVTRRACLRLAGDLRRPLGEVHSPERAGGLCTPPLGVKVRQRGYLSNTALFVLRVRASGQVVPSWPQVSVQRRLRDASPLTRSLRMHREQVVLVEGRGH
jgi:hypothetical protein